LYLRGYWRFAWRIARFLVASRSVRDLLLYAKHLLFEANRTSDRARTVARAHDVRTREWVAWDSGKSQ